MSGNSSVGNSGVYEAGDQRNVPQSEMHEAERYKEGKPNSHLAQDSKDNRTIANKLAREELRGDAEEFKTEEDKLRAKDATLPAKMHGNEPSRGAKLDQKLRDEEQEYLERKGKA